MTASKPTTGTAKPKMALKIEYDAHAYGKKLSKGFSEAPLACGRCGNITFKTIANSEASLLILICVRCHRGFPYIARSLLKKATGTQKQEGAQ